MIDIGGGGGGVNKEFGLDFSKIRSGGCGRHVPEDEILAAKTLAPPGIKSSRLLSNGFSVFSYKKTFKTPKNSLLVNVYSVYLLLYLIDRKLLGKINITYTTKIMFKVV
jgi:hypothetical protein